MAIHISIHFLGWMAINNVHLDKTPNCSFPCYHYHFNLILNAPFGNTALDRVLQKFNFFYCFYILISKITLKK